MTAPAFATHVDAVLALLSAGMPAEVTVFDGEPTGTLGETYVCVYSPPGDITSSNLANNQDQIAGLVQLTCVGSTPAQARAVKDKAAALLVGVRPAVSGRTTWRITQEPGAPQMQRDDAIRDPNVDRPRFYFTPQFRVASTT